MFNKKCIVSRLPLHTTYTHANSHAHTWSQILLFQFFFVSWQRRQFCLVAHTRDRSSIQQFITTHNNSNSNSNNYNESPGVHGCVVCHKTGVLPCVTCVSLYFCGQVIFCVVRVARVCRLEVHRPTHIVSVLQRRHFRLHNYWNVSGVSMICTATQKKKQIH